MKNRINKLCFTFLLGVLPSTYGAVTLPPPIITMPGASKPLVPPPAGSAPAATVNRLALAATAQPVNMKLLVLAGDVSEYSYISMIAYLNQIGVPYTGIGVDSLTPDSSGNRLSNLVLTDANGHGLYQGFIYTNSTFGVCNPNCVNLLTNADFTTLSNYITQFKIRVATYYTYPEPKWGLSIVGSGASYTASSPLQVSVAPGGTSVFPYINAANPIPVAGSGTGAIYAYQATAVAASGETTTPILTAGGNLVGVTHINSLGQESLSLTMDNYPTLLHSLALSYGVINWVTKGVFLGQRRIYLNSQIDDILFGDRLYAPTLPQCPNDPSCPVIIGTSSDIQALVNWQNSKHQDPQLTYLKNSYVYVGVGSTPGFAPVPDTVTPAMKTFANNFGWINHTWTHGDLDCYSLSSTGTCQPANLEQSLFEIERNAVFAKSLPIPDDTTGLVTPFNGGLANLAFFQAAAQEGVTSIISPNDPPSPGTGMTSIVPSVLLMPRRVTNLFADVDSQATGVYGSLPDEYNSFYGPNGKTPTFATNQTYSQIVDNESTTLLQLRMLNYESYPLGFHNSNAIAYDGTHSLLTDLFDATIKKYEKLYNLPIYTLQSMRDIAPLLLNRASYNASGVTGVYTPGVSIVLTTTNAGVIPVTGACSQASCGTYGGQIQDSVPMAAGSSVTLSLTAATGAGLSTVTANPGQVPSRTPSQGVVTLNGIATSAVIVNLSSSSTAVATVPASVTINPGDTGAAFTITTASVAAATTVNISATYNNVTRVVPVVVTPAVALSGFSLASSAAAGVSPVATLSLTGPAPAGGLTVSLISNNAAATVPSRVTVSAGASSATFNVTTLAVGTATSGTLVAVYNGVNLPAPLTVTPGIALALSNLVLMPTAVIGGNVSTGTVTLNGLAPTGGISIGLSSSTAGVTVPATVFVNAGSSTVTFTVTTTSVTILTSSVITATYSGGSTIATLTVAPNFRLTGVTLLPASVPGGGVSEGTVTISGPAPAGGTTVTLSSGNPIASVPTSVTVTAGNFTATFAVSTVAVASTTGVAINASYGGVTVSGTLTVTAPTGLSAVSLNPSSVTGGTSSTGTVTLSGAAPAGGLVISLSSNSAASTVPASVTVSAGATSATFTAATTAVTASTTAIISASSSGITKTSSLTITPSAALTGVSVNPASVIGGASSTGMVTLTTAAPAGGIVVTLSDNSSAVSTPASVTVAAGSTSATFALTTSAVSSVASVTITASYNGVATTTAITVNPAAALTGVSVNPASVIGGTSSTGTVTLTTAAPAGGIVVTLSDNSAAVSTPASVTVAAGSTSATFALTTSAVSSVASVTITASYNGVATTTAITVNPAAALTGVSVNPASVIGGASSTGTVTLTTAAPAGGIVVTLSDNSAAVSTPASVTVAAGSTNATFALTTSAVSSVTSVTISASYNGVTKMSTLTVNPLVALAALSVGPASVTGGSSATGTVTLTAAAPAGGIVVSLSDNSGAVSVPTTVTIAAGSTAAQFTVKTIAVSATANASISASFGAITKTAAIAVIPATLFDFNINPSRVGGFNSATGTVTLTGPAPSGGITVSISTDNSFTARVPDSVTITEGATTGTFTIATLPFFFDLTATVTAYYNGVGKSDTITVNGFFN